MEESNIDVLNANRMYKSRIFAMLFSDRNELLKLYNAINGTSYDDPDLLQVNTLENAVYMSMQNDVSFIIDMRLNLYEHQSTYSPVSAVCGGCVFGLYERYESLWNESCETADTEVCDLLQRPGRTAGPERIEIVGALFNSGCRPVSGTEGSHVKYQ